MHVCIGICVCMCMCVYVLNISTHWPVMTHKVDFITHSCNPLNVTPAIWKNNIKKWGKCNCLQLESIVLLSGEYWIPWGHWEHEWRLSSLALRTGSFWETYSGCWICESFNSSFPVASFLRTVWPLKNLLGTIIWEFTNFKKVWYEKFK